MKRTLPKHTDHPDISQSLILALKLQYALYFQGTGREFIGLVFLILMGFLMLYPFFKQDNSTQTVIPEITSNPDEATEQESPYMINPLSHTAWQPYLVAPGETLSQIFQKAGLSSETWQEIMQLDKQTQEHLTQVYAGKMIHLDTKNGQLIALTQSLDPIRTLYIIRKQDGTLSNFIHEKEVEKRMTFNSANIEDSLFLAGKRANIDDGILKQLADIFGCIIDFAHDIQPNDHFKVLYEEHFVGDQKINNGNILAIEFHNNGKMHQAIRYEDPDGKVGYYTPNGMSLKRAFLRTPVNFSRISSYFNSQRHHPILHTLRAHNGVDYVAPRGTPVKAVAEGTISYQGRKGGYGKTLILEHGHKRSTLYAHLSGFAKNIRPGQKIGQGQIIGYVGSTGLATGAHLHFEFRVDGQHRNPLTISLPHSDPIPMPQRPLFLAQASELMGLLEYHEKIMMASNEH